MNTARHSPQSVLDASTLPWQPIRPGFSLKALRATTDDEARVLLLRLEPGTVIPRHRHTGDVHAFNLAGLRKILDTGEIVGPGGYVYEPEGNVDSWMAIGDEPVVVHVVVRGAVEYVDDAGRVIERTTSGSMGEEYARYCATVRGAEASAS